MESLSAVLQPYKEEIGFIASVVTIGQFFSGGFICKDIFNAKTTKGTSSLPFVGGLTVGILMLKYSILLQDSAMLSVNLAACFLNVLYTLFYSFYSTDKYSELYQPAGYAVLLAGAFLGYAEYEDPVHLEYRYGLAVTVLMLLLIASPLKDLPLIIKSKDASSIPFPMTLLGFIVSFLWLLYAIVLLNNFMVVQNLLGFTLCGVQLQLILKYPGKKSKSQ